MKRFCKDNKSAQKNMQLQTKTAQKNVQYYDESVTEDCLRNAEEHCFSVSSCKTFCL